MRKKSDERREAILAAAAREFGERGYDGASMSNIVVRSGGSKQTLYNYFPSKEQLFVEVMTRTATMLTEKAYAQLVPNGGVAETLCRYGERYLEARQAPELVSLFRLVFAESGRTDIGKMLYERGRMTGIRALSLYLSMAMQERKLRRADPTVAAHQLLALLAAELIDPVILGVREPATRHEISEITARAVEMFMAAYRMPR